MRQTVRLFNAIALAFLCALPMGMAMAADAESVVQQQFDAYNAHDIRAFMATYAANAQILEFPSKVLLEGQKQIEEAYSSKLFPDPRLHANLEKRMVMGNIVIDHEKVDLTYPEGPGQAEGIAIYEVVDGKIAKVTLIHGRKVLNQAKQ